MGGNCPCLFKPKTAGVEPSIFSGIALCRIMLSNALTPLQFLGLIMKMEELYSYYFLKIQFKLSVTEEKKQTPLPTYLKRTQFDFANAKQLVDLKPGGKKVGSFCCCFSNSQIVHIFIIHWAIFFALALSSFAWIPLLKHLRLLHGTVGNPRAQSPDLAP